MSDGPASVPILGRGRHRSPARGACFLEYTSLLAGEPFSDDPSCVDGELAAVLRRANDTMSDADRPLLLPLLGRSIGLAVPEPVAARPQRRFRRRVQEWDVRELADHAAAVGRLREAVTRLFTAAVGPRSTPAGERGHLGDQDVDRLFWSLMSEPAPVGSRERYADRLVARLELLHRCYEQAMAELGPPGTAPAPRQVPVAGS